MASNQYNIVVSFLLLISLPIATTLHQAFAQSTLLIAKAETAEKEKGTKSTENDMSDIVTFTWVVHAFALVSLVPENRGVDGTISAQT